MPGVPVRVLLVQGSAQNVQLLRLALRELGPEFELSWANGLAAALQLLAAGPFGVILLDPLLPDTPAEEAVRQLRAASPDVPLLLLASAHDVAICLRAMEAGAHDYLFKDVLTMHLLTRMIRDAVERPAQAPPGGSHLVDPLTGLANHEGLLAQTAQLWRTPLRLRKGATLLYLTLGGPVANSAHDEALAEVAELLRETFRGSDLRARVGPRSFALLAIGAPEPTASILTARLDEALNTRNSAEPRPYRLTLSVGLSHYDAEEPCSFEELLRQAEASVGAETLGSANHPAPGAPLAVRI
jgi:diguanylate cyclase (GGDEF)-like protein